MNHANDNKNASAEELWRHEDPKSTPMWRFLELVNKKYGSHFQTYAELHRWSVDNVAAFWEEVWHFTGIVASAPYTQVVAYAPDDF